MTHWGARTRQIGTFPVDRENISPAQNAGLPEGSGTGFLHKKRVPEVFPLPSSPRAHRGARGIIHLQKSFLPAVHFLHVMIFEPWTKGYLLALTYDAARQRDRDGL